MVGVINADSSTELVNQIELAKQSDYMLLPGEPFPQEEQTSNPCAQAPVTAAGLGGIENVAPPSTSSFLQPPTR